tara:strand:- start:84 stop:497 length:414 start_codon:yes stop_codon:yes gene_type:complete
MYAILKTIAESNKWEFEYGRSDYNNLYDAQEKKLIPQIFLDPVVIEKQFGEYNEQISQTEGGSFMILVSSDIDEESYDIRYTKYIQPLISTSMGIIESAISCDETYVINSWRLTEVINVFDYNMDGIICTYNLTKDI